MYLVDYKSQEEFRPDRLLKMAELLEADADNETGVQFDLRLWVGPAVPLTPMKERYQPSEKVDVIPIDCGTKACAFGLTALSGIFKDDGLSVAWDERLGLDSISVIGYNVTPVLRANGDRYDGFDAAEVLFGISDRDASYLFTADAYPVSHGAEAELAVATRIRNLVGYKVEARYHRDYDMEVEDDIDEDDFDEDEDEVIVEDE